MAIPVNNRYPNSRELFEPVYPESDCYLESEKIARYTLEQERQMSLDDRELPTVLERWSQEAVDIGVEIDQERLMVKWVEEDTVLVEKQTHQSQRVNTLRYRYYLNLCCSRIICKVIERTLFDYLADANIADLESRGEELQLLKQRIRYKMPSSYSLSFKQTEQLCLKVLNAMLGEIDLFSSRPEQYRVYIHCKAIKKNIKERSEALITIGADQMFCEDVQRVKHRALNLLSLINSEDPD